MIDQVSLNFDPLEKRISEIKCDLRSGRARAELGPLLELVRATEKVTPEDIRDWFKHCGYTRLLE
jgi:hypothetical protein